MLNVHQVPPRVQPQLRLVGPAAPCPSEASYGAACYLAFHRQRNRWCDRCSAECPSGDVPAWMARPREGDGPPGEPRLPMADWIEVRAAGVRLLGTELAGWLADKIDRIADDCRWYDASTPAEFDARAEVMAAAIADHDRRAIDEDYCPAAPH